MTVAVAWVRTLHDCQELVFVTDSRLSGDGRTFDFAPKLLALPRNDCIISFAGYTGDVYPMMMQLAVAIESHLPLQRRSVDLPKLKKHALKIFQSMAESIASPIPENQGVGAEFLFGGYSWVKKTFDLWRIVFEQRRGLFLAHPARTLFRSTAEPGIFFGHSPRQDAVPLGRVAFGGDQAEYARRLFLEYMTEKVRASSAAGSEVMKLDMEPFEIVRDMLRAAGRSPTIGGAPQVMKVYQYMQAGPLAVYWPDKATGKVHLRGRPRLDYENIDTWIIDPDTLGSENPRYPAGSPNEPLVED